MRTEMGMKEVYPRHGDVVETAITDHCDHVPHLLQHAILRAVQNQVSEARKITQTAVADHPLSDIAVLLVSELMSNAVIHSGSQFVTLLITAAVKGDLHISVIDEGRGGLPCLRDGGPDDEHGRGIRLVDQLSKRWGITRELRG